MLINPLRLVPKHPEKISEQELTAIMELPTAPPHPLLPLLLPTPQKAKVGISLIN